MKIDRVTARTIPDTRGRPTVETTLYAGELSATASVPSGKSTGEHEAKELHAAQAVENVTGEIAAALGGRDTSLDELDELLIALDGTRDKSRLGANAILSVSLAAMRLSALQEGVPLWKAIAGRASGEQFSRVSQVQRHPRTPSGVRGLSETLSETAPPSDPPRLFVNVMNGGAHADFRLPFQEYILVVEGKTSSALPIAHEAFAKLGERLGASTPMGDEGGYAPTFETLEKPFEILSELVEEFPNTSIAIDAAASELFKDGAYQLLGKSYSPEELTVIYESIVAKYSLHSIEDPFDEHASADFTRLTATLGARKILVVGDDFTCTNPALIANAIQERAINAVLIKPNQIGTVKEALEAVQTTRDAGWEAICSHRSGETADTFISDFAYGIGAYGLKAGGLGQSERLAKYDRLLAIEREIDSDIMNA